MSETYEITKDDIPLVMQILEIKSIQDFANELGITTRSLGDTKMKPWRQMSIECLLRRQGRWEVFCQLRGKPESKAKPEVVADAAPGTIYKCIVCDRCLGTLHEHPAKPSGE